MTWLIAITNENSWGGVPLTAKPVALHLDTLR
jgi:hypothetical protein